MSHLRVSSAALVMALATACSSESPPDRIAHVDLVVGAGHVALVRAERVPADAPPIAAPATSGAQIRWEFRDGDRVLASGQQGDPRLVTVETFGGGGSMASGTALAGAGPMFVDIPDRRGTLRVSDSGGRLLGELAYEPVGAVGYAADRGGNLGKADIDFETDLIGTPVLITGSGVADHHVNLLVVPEGYTAGELAKFHTDAAALIANLKTVAGYAENWDSINAFYQDIKSAESGISEPAGPAKDTAFNVAYGDDMTAPRRCLMPAASWSAVSAGNAARLADTVQADVIVVISNVGEGGEGGGCARGNFIVMANDLLDDNTLGHELGHALFALRDEYEGDTCRPEQSDHQINVSRSAVDLPWQDLVTPGTPLPTPPGSGDVVGAFEGANHCTEGVFRPQETCLMRSLDAPLCAVCRQRAAEVFEQRKTAINVVTVTNSTGAKMWVTCDWTQTTGCKWKPVEADETVTLRTGNGSIVLDTSTVADAPVRWVAQKLTVPSARFSIYANAVDPLTPPAPPIDGGVDAPPGACGLAQIVINEIQTAGTSAADEFIELYNPCAVAVDLAGSRLVYRGPASTSDSATLTVPAGSIPPAGYYVAANTGFAGPANVHQLGSGLNAVGGGVGLRNAAGELIDSVGWGTATNAFVEGTPAPAPPASRSIGRTPNGADSQRNAIDLVVGTASTPNAAN
jgi:hypothetical protein